MRHLDLSVAKGETVGIVGESGSGKSVTSYAVMRILDRAGRIAGGKIRYSNIDITDSPLAMRNLRGRELAMIFQNPRAALNPIRKIGHQIEDVLRQHIQAGPATSGKRPLKRSNRYALPSPEERYHAYPFELSGGMCQRVVIALALACRPPVAYCRRTHDGPRCHHPEGSNGTSWSSLRASATCR